MCFSFQLEVTYFYAIKPSLKCTEIKSAKVNIVCYHYTTRRYWSSGMELNHLYSFHKRSNFHLRNNTFFKEFWVKNKMCVFFIKSEVTHFYATKFFFKNTELKSSRVVKCSHYTIWRFLFTTGFEPIPFLFERSNS